MKNKFLSNIELYYSDAKHIEGNQFKIEGEEYKHILKVMRHREGDEIYVTDGQGKIYTGNISGINKEYIIISIKDILSYEKRFSNITFCIPKLKNSQRFEFALEKCTELGITNFIIYDAEHSVSKGNKITRWHRIVLSAMKQSLLSFLPRIEVINSLNEIKLLQGEKIIFEQTSEIQFNSSNLNENDHFYFIFGPEGGLSREEVELFKDNRMYCLTKNRLRTETAVIKCASLL